MAERRGVKRRHSVSTFQKEWSKTWLCIQPVKLHSAKVSCTVCRSTFAIAHQGRRDVERHIEGSEHKHLAGIVNSCQSITSSLPDQAAHETVTKLRSSLLVTFWSTIYHLKLLLMLVLSFEECFLTARLLESMDAQQPKLLQS